MKVHFSSLYIMYAYILSSFSSGQLLPEDLIKFTRFERFWLRLRPICCTVSLKKTRTNVLYLYKVKKNFLLDVRAEMISNVIN